MTRLPVSCALALALDDCGLSAFEISRRVALPAASVPSLLKISTAKLAALDAAAPSDAATGRGDDQAWPEDPRKVQRPRFS